MAADATEEVLDELIEPRVEFHMVDEEPWLNDYKLVGVIGEGSYGEVFLASADDSRYAVKLFSRRKLARQSAFLTGGGALARVANEAVALQLLGERRVAGVPRLVRVMEDPRSVEFAYVLELANGGAAMVPSLETELFDARDHGDLGVPLEYGVEEGSAPPRLPLGPGTSVFSEERARTIVAGLLRVLADVHAAGIVHRDIKPENILLHAAAGTDAPSVWLCDFGSCQVGGPPPADGDERPRGGRAAGGGGGMSRARSVRQVIAQSSTMAAGATTTTTTTTTTTATGVGSGASPSSRDTGTGGSGSGSRVRGVLRRNVTPPRPSGSKPPLPPAPPTLADFEAQGIDPPADVVTSGEEAGGRRETVSSRVAERRATTTLTEETWKVRHVPGTPAFLPPETLSATFLVDGRAVDMWAVGITTFVLVTGRVPFGFQATDLDVLWSEIRAARVRFPRDRTPSKELRSFIGACLHPDPDARLTVSDALAHPWLAGNPDAEAPYLRSCAPAASWVEALDAGVLDPAATSRAGDLARAADQRARADLVMAEAGTPLRSGWILKRGRLFKTWKRRYMLVKDGQLLYFAARPADEESLSLPALAKIAKGSMSLAEVNTLIVRPKPDKHYRFLVATRTRDLYLRTDTLRDAVLWLRSLRTHVAEAGGVVESYDESFARHGITE